MPSVSRKAVYYPRRLKDCIDAIGWRSGAKLRATSDILACFVAYWKLIERGTLKTDLSLRLQRLLIINIFLLFLVIQKFY